MREGHGISMYKILMVDDDPIILEDNENYIGASGYEVFCADTTQAAKKHYIPNSLHRVILVVY